MTWQVRAIDWDYWTEGWNSADCITALGKNQLHSSISDIASFFGADYLQRCQLSPPHELLSMEWIFNKTPDVAHRILTLGAQIALLQNVNGWSQFQRDVRGDLGHFDHSMVQLEVAGLALRGDWKVSLEPETHDQRSTDISMTRSDEHMYVEVKGFRLDSTTSLYLSAGRQLEAVLFQALIEFGVWTKCHLAGDVTKLDTSGLYDRLRVAASEAIERHSDVFVNLGTHGQLVVSPDPPKDGVLHSYEIHHADELGRIAAQIHDKAEQGRGVEPLWI